MVPHLFRSKPRSQTPQHAFLSLCIWDSKRFLRGRLVQWRTRYLLEMNWRPHMSLTWGINMGQQKMAPRPIPSLQKTHGSGILGLPPLPGFGPGNPFISFGINHCQTTKEMCLAQNFSYAHFYLGRSAKDYMCHGQHTVYEVWSSIPCSYWESKRNACVHMCVCICIRYI